MWEHLDATIPTYALYIYGVLIVIELAFELTQKVRGYKLGDTLCSLTMGGFYIGMSVLMKGFTLWFFYYVQKYALFDFGQSWVAFIACYIAVDFLFYWYHRCIHEVRVGWAAHVAHHSSEEFNLGATAFRQSFAEPLLEPFFYVGAVLIGFDPLMVLVAIQINLIYMFWVHLRRFPKMHPAIEWLFVTPSHHRVHHAANIQYLDKNYSGTFIIWDRMFGSFAEEIETPEFGIVQQLRHNNPIRASFDSWIALAGDVWRAKGVRNKLGYLFRPPGWAPDGQGMTTRQRREAADAAGSAT